mgnify:CR=1 FL=1|jgi:hypothetical protein
MIAGQFYYMGTCDVAVTSSAVTVGNCHIAPGWTADLAHFYLGEEPNDSCSPGGFGYQQSFTATTGALPASVSTSMARSGSNEPVYVMLHMDTQR